MENFSQGKEQETILNYFNGQFGTFLDLGANDGKTLSNTFALAINGWTGVAVEAAPDTFKELKKLYSHTDNVQCINVAVSDFVGKADFYVSGTHLNTGDKSLLSSLGRREIKRWGNTAKFEKIEVDVVDFATLLKLSEFKEFQFISVDIEGEDLKLLRQLNLKEIGCKCLCIEHNGNQESLNEIEDYCARHGLTKMLLKNAENVILSV